MHPTVIYEDKDFVAVNKPAGLIVHEARSVPARRSLGVGGKREAHGGQKEPTLVDWLFKHYPEIKNVGDEPTLRPGIVHRLDRDTSGIMVAAKTQASFEYLKSLFQAHAIRKKYLALVHGILREKRGVIDAPIGIASGSVKRSVRGTRLVKEATTRYVVKREFGEGDKSFSLLEVAPETGRTHQIRVHLASLHHPIAGDMLYGKAAKRKPIRQAQGREEGGRRGKEERAIDAAPRLMLHAFSLEFSTKEGQRLTLEAEAPRDFMDFIKSIKPNK